MRKGRGRRPLLVAHGLRALRRLCITHRHDSIIDITKWAQEYFQTPLLVNTICRSICRCQLKLYHAKRKPYVNMVQKLRCVLWAKTNLQWTVSKWKSIIWSDESKFDILVGNHGRRVLQAKVEGDLPACYQYSVQKPASLMEWVAYMHTVWATCMFWKAWWMLKGIKRFQSSICSPPDNVYFRRTIQNHTLQL